MDKRSIIGLVLIGVILFGFTWYNSSKQKEYEQQRAETAAAKAMDEILNPQPITPEHSDDMLQQAAGDSLTAAQYPLGEYLYEASRGEEQFTVVENDLMKIRFSNCGGRAVAVELKEYTTYNKTPLMLFEGDDSKFDISFFITQGYNSAQINTSDYYFTPQPVVQTAAGEGGGAMQTFTMRLAVDSAAYMEYIYTIPSDSYMIDFDVRFVGMENILAQNQSDLEISWENVAYQTEKGYSNENSYTTVVYHYPEEKGIKDVGMSKEAEAEEFKTKVDWVGFKKQFFSSIFVAEGGFANGDVGYTTFPENSGKIKKFSARLSVPYTPSQSEYNFNFYFGPNKFSVLKKFDLHFERLVPLGSWIIGWINRYIVIPVFDTLGKYINSYGIIILILTIILKVLTAPLTYKSYLSSAKMRLLKPDVDKLNEKYPKPEDAMKKQQATMALYKSAGANPMGGCLPLLIQFPILFAMFRFFPASIELRGESFLWADDLSSYDSILELPFNIPFYGSHISLFALLMAVAVFVSSKINYNQTAGSTQQMPGMKFMMLYMMPVMLLLWFNNYSAGLSYYYLVSNIFTIGQTMAFRYGVDDEKLHRKMKENAKNAPTKKKSKWQERYEEAVKMQQQQQAAAKKKK